jgi:hypothetical protein
MIFQTTQANAAHFISFENERTQVDILVPVVSADQRPGVEQHLADAYSRPWANIWDRLHLFGNVNGPYPSVIAPIAEKFHFLLGDLLSRSRYARSKVG